jgi:hypothetical protein
MKLGAFFRRGWFALDVNSADTPTAAEITAAGMFMKSASPRHGGEDRSKIVLVVLAAAEFLNNP